MESHERLGEPGSCGHSIATGTKARTSLAKIKLQGTSFGSSIRGRTDGLTISNGQEPNSPAEPPSAESRFKCSPSMLRTSSRCELPSWKKTHLLSKSRRWPEPTGGHFFKLPYTARSKSSSN